MRRPTSMRPPTIRTPEIREKFLNAMVEFAGNVSISAKVAGVTRKPLYMWYDDDPEFAADWNTALRIGNQALIDEAIRRAYHGVDEPMTYLGQPTYGRDGKQNFLKRYSDPMLIFIIKQRGMFVERSSQELTGPNGGAIQVETVRDRIAGRIAGIADRSGSGEGAV